MEVPSSEMGASSIFFFWSKVQTLSAFPPLLPTLQGQLTVALPSMTPVQTATAKVVILSSEPPQPSCRAPHRSLAWVMLVTLPCLPLDDLSFFEFTYLWSRHTHTQIEIESSHPKAQAAWAGEGMGKANWEANLKSPLWIVGTQQLESSQLPPRVCISEKLKQAPEPGTGPRHSNIRQTYLIW